MDNGEEMLVTDPYCPPIGALSPDDTPLVVESSDKLPPVNNVFSHVSCFM